MPSFLPQSIITDITHCATQADKLAREKLNSGKIVDENDYTSNFTCLLDFAINLLQNPGLRSSIQKLNPSRERALGADGCIILENIPAQKMKVGIFEAKWPRLTVMNYAWDYIHSSGDSHFHTQLDRQEKHIQNYAIWEMFYLEHSFNQQPHLMPAEGSACAWQEDIFPVSQTITHPNKIWKNSNLLSMPPSTFLSISKILEEICECKRGLALDISSVEKLFSKGICPGEAIVVTYLGN